MKIQSTNSFEVPFVVLLFAALALIFTGIQLAAQQPAPDTPGTGVQQDAPPPPPGPPPPAVLENLIPADQLSFLHDYANDTRGNLLKDKRFKNAMKQAIPHTEYHYGSDKSLMDASEELLGTMAIPITIRDHRYVTISTRGGSYLAGKTMMWFDMQSGMAVGSIYFHPTNGEPAPTLTIFSRQLADTSWPWGSYRRSSSLTWTDGREGRGFPRFHRDTLFQPTAKNMCWCTTKIIASIPRMSLRPKDANRTTPTRPTPI